jgi:molybdopterin synthase catalytic subunit
MSTTLSASSLHQVEAETIYISDKPLDINHLLKSFSHPGAGAQVIFSGTVRNNNNNKAVNYLEYEAHVQMASGMIHSIIIEASEKWSLTHAMAIHRIGRVGIGESAVIVITSSAHREEAYLANQYIIDKIKHDVPVWKCEYYVDGTKQWGNNCNC